MAGIKKEITMERLAGMVQKGFVEVNDKIDKLSDSVDKRFEQVDKRFEQIDGRFEQVDDRFRNIEAHLAMLSRDMGEIRQNFVYRYEFDDVLSRLKLVEKKLKIKSGK